MFEIKLIFYGLSRMLQFSQFVLTPCYSVWEVFNNFLLIDATDRRKIRGGLSFFANTPFKRDIFFCERKLCSWKWTTVRKYNLILEKSQLLLNLSFYNWLNLQGFPQATKDETLKTTVHNLVMACSLQLKTSLTIHLKCHYLRH